MALRRSILAGSASAKAVSIEWFTARVLNHINLTMRRRVRLATSLLKARVIVNLSMPVKRITGPRGGVIIQRSRPGEFPRADTLKLMRTIFSDTATVAPGIHEGYVGTPLDYGMFLEVFQKRSFLTRTLFSLNTTISKILLQPVSTSRSFTIR